MNLTVQDILLVHELKPIFMLLESCEECYS